MTQKTWKNDGKYSELGLPAKNENCVNFILIATVWKINNFTLTLKNFRENKLQCDHFHEFSCYTSNLLLFLAILHKKSRQTKQLFYYYSFSRNIFHFRQNKFRIFPHFPSQIAWIFFIMCTYVCTLYIGIKFAKVKMPIVNSLSMYLNDVFLTNFYLGYCQLWRGYGFATR